MKTLLRLCRLVALLAALAVLRLPAQSPVELGIAAYAGLTVTGEVGRVYTLQYVDHLAHTNTPEAWRCLELLQLPASPHLWIDRSAPATGRRFYRAVELPAPTNMVFIPPGTFRMGSPTNEVDRLPEEGPTTAVTITRGFWMGKFEVTQAEYLAVMGYNPTWFTTDRGYAPDLRRPADMVSWDDATNYCHQRTQREREAGLLPPNCRYRLPTEAEWEYACRAGTSTRFSHGDDPGYSQLGDYAWSWANADRVTHAVGQKLPNPWGLHDMHGNVFEWCQDWWAAALPGGLALDPRGPAAGTSRVLRRGAWDAVASDCRSAGRNGSEPGNRGYDFGFRVVLAPGDP